MDKEIFPGKEKKKIIVIGGGAAGMMASIRASQLKADVTLIEKNLSLGRKILLTGKGRCNLTNACGLDSFLKRLSRNGQFLRDAFKSLSNRDLMEFFENRGLKLKVERQQRVFPVTDRASDVVEMMRKELVRNKVKIHYKQQVEKVIIADGKLQGVLLKDHRMIDCHKLIFAMGGTSYGFTGSTGDGFRIAQEIGHRVVPLRAGLTPLEVRGNIPRMLEGLTLKNIRLKFCCENQKKVSEIGELLFTNTGISGPLVLSSSGFVVDWLRDGKPVFVEIDCKPNLSKEILNERFLREFKSVPQKNIKNVLRGFLPLRMVIPVLEYTPLPPQKKASQITQRERESLISLLKGLRLTLVKERSIEKAMITRGGISLKEINPRTMESRIIKGLYFAGEMIDVDADTGGFNLQSAFSTGYLAGESAASASSQDSNPLFDNPT